MSPAEMVRSLVVRSHQRTPRSPKTDRRRGIDSRVLSTAGIERYPMSQPPDRPTRLGNCLHWKFAPPKLPDAARRNKTIVLGLMTMVHLDSASSGPDLCGVRPK